MEKIILRKSIIFGIIVVLFGSAFLPYCSESIKNTNVRASHYHQAPIGKNIIYVDDDAPAPWYGTWTQPYNKIQVAIDNANPGDDIYVCNGTYQDIGPVCYIDKSLTIYAGGNDPHGGDNQYPPVINASFFNNTIFVNALNVTITGFNITGSGQENATSSEGNLYYKYAGIYVKSQPFNTNCIILNNIIHHNGVGICSYGYTFITNNTISNNLDDGIKTKEGIIRGNYIACNGCEEPRNEGDGIEIHETAGISVINNTILDNHLDGIWDDTGDHHTISGNLIKNNHQCGINLLEAKECEITNNILLSNRLIGIFINVSTSNNFINNTLSNNHRNIYLVDCAYNTFENNTISYNNDTGIYLLKSTNNKIAKNFIWYNQVGILDGFSSSNQISNNDFRENNISIDLIYSFMDVIRYNNIISTSKIKLRAIASIAIAISNYWGDWRGPWFDMNRILLGIVIVFPWLLQEVPLTTLKQQEMTIIQRC